MAEVAVPVLMVDAKGLSCPLPILKARKALAGLRSGDHLGIDATDPGAVVDFPAFCRQAGHRLLRSDVIASPGACDIYHFEIIKG